MRPIWSGYISFGLVNIPVNLFTAEKKFDVRFHLLDSRNKSRIRYQRINEETGKEVPWDKIVHGYELKDGNYITLKNEEFNKISTPAKSIAIENFVDKEEVDYEYFETPYYLVPEKNSLKSYVLLRETLTREKKIGIAKVAIRGREHLAAIMPLKSAIVLNLLRFKQELRPITDFEFPEGNTQDYKITKKELELAKQLIDSMSENWKPEKYHDEYREKLMQWIEKKTKEEALQEKEEPKEEITEPVNLINLMKKSMTEMLKKGTINKQSSINSRKKKNEPRAL